MQTQLRVMLQPTVLFASNRPFESSQSRSDSYVQLIHSFVGNMYLQVEHVYLNCNAPTTPRTYLLSFPALTFIRLPRSPSFVFPLSPSLVRLHAPSVVSPSPAPIPLLTRKYCAYIAPLSLSSDRRSRTYDPWSLISNQAPLPTVADRRPEIADRRPGVANQRLKPASG